MRAVHSAVALSVTALLLSACGDSPTHDPAAPDPDAAEFVLDGDALARHCGELRGSRSVMCNADPVTARAVCEAAGFAEVKGMAELPVLEAGADSVSKFLPDAQMYEISAVTRDTAMGISELVCAH